MLNCGPYILYIGNDENPPITDEICQSFDTRTVYDFNLIPNSKYELN